MVPQRDGMGNSGGDGVGVALPIVQDGAIGHKTVKSFSRSGYRMADGVAR